MKKFILFLLVALVALTSGAQEKNEVVVPNGLQTTSWLLTAQRYNAQEYTISTYLPLTVGYDGQDVYVRGLNMYLPNQWVKGVRNGNQITFAKNQYYGEMSDDGGTSYDTYFAGCEVSWFGGVSELQPIDVVFTVNEAENCWTTETVLVVNTSLEAIAGFDYLKDVVIAKAIDGAATPQAPSISFFNAYDAESGYGGVALDFPPVDVDGRALDTDQLSYVIYKDVNHQVEPLTFTVYPNYNVDPYDETSEQMTEIPYDYTDGYTIEAGGYAAYFYEESASWNRIGVQAVYRGGGEEHKSEIAWKTLIPFFDECSVFNFNAMDKTTTPVSTSSSHAGDITEDKVLTADHVTLTITPSGVNDQNRYWVDYNLQAIQLRVYGGELDFDAEEGYTIEQMFFNTGDWEEYNEFDCGEFSDEGVWTGSSQQVVLRIYGNTKINWIALTLKENATGVRTTRLLPVEMLRTYDLQGRQTSADAKGLVVRQMLTADGRIRTVKGVQH